MTIEEERFIDFIGVSKKHGTQILTISDHLTWTAYEHHSLLLQNKINYYLEYIYSSKIYESKNRQNKSDIRIQLIMKHEPTRQAAILLQNIEANLDDLGFEFVYSVYDEEEKPDKAL